MVLPTLAGGLMARRALVLGFEGGVNHTGNNAPTDGNITVQSTVKRTGNHALRVNAQSGVRSSLTLTTGGGTGDNTIFFRGYFRLASSSIGATPRMIWGMNSSSLSNWADLRLGTDRILRVHAGGTTAVATGSTPLTLNTWHCLEIGLNVSGTPNLARRIAVRLNDQTEIDWVSFASSGPTGVTTLSIGALDTVTGAFEAFWDDIAVDRERWCEPGEVHGIEIAAVASDNTAWTNIGGAASKAAALSDASDATYLVSSGSGVGTQILFGLNPPPSALHVRGAGLWLRVQRDGANLGNVAGSRRLDGQSETATGASTGATAAWVSALHNSHGPIGYDLDRVGEILWGFRSESTNPSRVLRAHVEIDITNDPAQKAHSRRAFIASCDTGDTSEFTEVIGTPVASTTRVRTGTYAIRIRPAGTTSQAVVTLISADVGPLNAFYGRFYLWIEARPNNTVELLHIGTGFNTARRCGIQMNANGQLCFTDRDSLTNSPASPYSTATLRTSRWLQIEYWFQTATTSGGNDGRGMIWVDDQLVLSSNSLGIGSLSGVNTYLGVVNNQATNTCELYLDDIAVDYGTRIRSTKIVDLPITTIGTLPGTTWGTSGGTLVTAVAETPADEDTSYIISPLSNLLADSISYHLSDLPSPATFLHAVRVAVRARRDGSTNGIIQTGLRVNNINGASGNNVTTTASYATTRQLQVTTQFMGAWTPGLYNGAEVIVMPASTANRSRVTNVRVTVEYVELTTGFYEVAADAYLVGANTRTRRSSLTATGFVLDPGPGVTCDAIIHDPHHPSVEVTRLYLARSQAGYNPGRNRGDWDIRRIGMILTPAKLASQKEGHFAISSSNKHIETEINQGVEAFVSDPLRAQTIQGRLRFCFAPYSTQDGAFNVTLQLHAWVTQGNSSHLRGTLINNFIEEWPTHAWGNTGIAREIDLSPELQPVTIETGDRIVLEIGYYSRSVATGTAGLIPYGGHDKPDLVAGDPSDAGIPWIEFSSLPIDTVEITPIEYSTALMSDATVFGTITHAVTADGHLIVFTTHTLTLEANALVTSSAWQTITSDALLGETHQLELTADATMGIEVALETGADSLVRALTSQQATADAVLRATLAQAASADAVLAVTHERTVAADGLVWMTTTLTLGADALLRATAALPINADGYLEAPVTTLTVELTSDGLLVTPGWRELTSDATLHATNMLETEANALLREAMGLDVIASALLMQTGKTVTLIVDSVVLEARPLDLPGDALLRETLALALESDALVGLTSLLELDGDAMVRVERTLDLSSEAVIRATLWLTLLSDGYLVERAGLLSARPRVATRLVAIRTTTSRITARLVVVAPGHAPPAIGPRLTARITITRRIIATPSLAGVEVA